MSTIIWGDYGAAPTESRFARPERRWGCRRGTPTRQAGRRLVIIIVIIITVFNTNAQLLGDIAESDFAY